MKVKDGINIKNYFQTKCGISFIAFFCALLWGSAFPVLKTSYTLLNLETININGKIYFAGLRFFIASCILFLFLKLIKKEPLSIDKTQFLKLSLLGFIQTTMQYFFFYTGLANITGIKGSILSSCSIFFVIIFSHFYDKNDVLNWNKIFGLMLGFIGILIANWNKGIGNLEFTLLGEGFLIMSGVVGAIGTIMAKKMSATIQPFVMTAWQMLIGSSILLTIGISTKGYSNLTFDKTVMMLLMYASFLSAIAFSLWYSLLKYNRAGIISMYKFLIPIIGSALSIIFLPGEKFNMNLILALILVSSGIIVVNKRRIKGD